MKIYLKESLKYFLRSKLLISREIKKVQGLYDMSAEQLYEYEEEQFLKIFRWAYTKSAFYYKFYSNAGINIEDVKSLKDIEKLPILTKDIVKENVDSILTIPKMKVFKTSTSGTTGSALSFFHSYKSIRLEQAFVWETRKRYGFKYNDKLVSLKGNLNRKKFKMYVHVSNTLYLSSYNLNKDSTLDYYKELKAFQPKALEGFPSSIYNLCLFLKEKGLKLNIPYTFTSSEKLFHFQRNLIENVLNTKVYDWYGCTEKTIALAENINHDGYFEVPGYAVNEFSEDNVITTSLFNFAFPFIRYKVKDQILIDNNTDKQRHIVEVIGRVEDNVVGYDGTVYCGMGYLFKDLKFVKIAQVLQNEIGKINICLVADKGYSIKEERNIMDKVNEKMGPQNMDVEFKLIKEDEIVYTDRNKFSLTISSLNQNQ